MEECLDPLKEKSMRSAFDYLQLCLPKQKKKVCKLTGAAATARSSASDLSRYFLEFLSQLSLELISCNDKIVLSTVNLVTAKVSLAS